MVRYADGRLGRYGIRWILTLVVLSATSVFADARKIEVRSSRECVELPREVYALCNEHKGASSSFWYARYDSGVDCARLSDPSRRSACVATTSGGDEYVVAMDSLTKIDQSELEPSKHHSKASRNRDIAVIAVVGLLAGVVAGSLIALHIVLGP
jgi:hypothetical protein